MTAAYRFKGIGWFAVLVGVILGCYLVSLRVAAEHKKLDDMNLAIASAQRDIRALETEFDTRANLAQLEKWNGDALALAAPTTAQFVPDDRALAALDPNGPGGPTVQTAALIVPAATVVPPSAPAAPSAAPAPTAKPAPAAPAPQVRMAAVAPVQHAPRPTPAVLQVAPSGRSAPAIARAVEAARGVAAVAKVRPQAVAMLDRKLLSDSTFGDILSGARREARR